MWVALLVAGCTPDPPPGHAGAPSSPGDTQVTTPPDTTPTGGTTGTPAPPYDCAALPDLATFVADLPYMPTFEDFTFDADGYAWGVSLYVGELIRVPFGGPAEVLRPGVTLYARGTRFLPDGRLVVADYPNNALITIDTSTYASVLLTGALTTPNGIAIGDDGFVYLSQLSGQLLRIDPGNGAQELVVESPVSNDGISFSPDYRTLYLNSDSTSDFMAIGIDAYGVATGSLALVAELPGAADGMVVDACGNAYQTQFDPPGLVRVRPDGTVEPFLTLDDGALPVAANFGTGVGGWAPDHLYVSDWNGGFTEWDAGVYGKWEPHLPPGATAAR